MKDGIVTTSQAEKTENKDFGFVGYRDYKESEFYQRYVNARSKVPQNALIELTTETPKKEIKKTGVGRGVAVIIFAILYLALCVIGYFIHSEDSIIASLLGVFDGKDLITTVLGLISGDITDIVDLIGAGALTVATVLAVFAFIGGIVIAASGKGVGKLMKTGCCIMFFLIVASFVCVIVRRLDITIGLSVLTIFAGIITLIALAAPKKIKEKK